MRAQQLRHVRTGVQVLGQVVNQCAHIEASRALDPQGQVGKRSRLYLCLRWLLLLEQLQRIDRHWPRSALHLDSFASQGIQPLPCSEYSRTGH